jgi:phage tail-like protein
LKQGVKIAMTEISSYVDYLPSALWSQENDSSQFLGRMLLIFERILTGTPDGISIRHGTHVDYNFEKTIDELTQMFNPWKTDKKFLPWLASWVALTLPEDLSEYQKRKIISDIVSIYQKRGLKECLHAYLDIYVTEAKPRIAIDDGDAILRATFLDNGTATLHSVAHSNEVLGQVILLHPSAIATDCKNSYIVVDHGNPFLSPPQPALWKVSSTGDIDYTLTGDQKIPKPKPFYSGKPLARPTAVIVDKQNKYSVVDTGLSNNDDYPDSAIFRFNPDIETVIDKSTNPSFPAVYPVDMILDGSENFVVLDRGAHPIGESPGSLGADSGQKIVVVSERPLTVSEHRLKNVIEPTVLAINSTGCFIVADARDQLPPEPADSAPADLVMVDPNNEWEETSLLDMVENNPLIFPTGLAFEDSQTLLVCDTGVRGGFVDEEANKTMAEPAAIYRIDLSQTPPGITRVTYERKLVNPTKIMIDRKGKLIITDKGESSLIPQREWRSKANEFGVIVLFSQQRSTSSKDRNRIRWRIEDILNEQKPAYTSWWMKS